VSFGKERKERRGPSSSWPGSPAPEGVLFVAARRRRRWCGVPNVATTPPPGNPTPGWCARPRSSTTSYFYCLDEDFGPFFLNSAPTFPTPPKLCVNGNEWAKRQAANAGIGFTALDNGSPRSTTWRRCNRSATGLGPAQIDALLRKWLAILPHRSPTTTRPAATATSCHPAGRVLADPHARRAGVRAIFFEQVLHDNLDIGRPDQVGLIFDRRIIAKGRAKTPGRFRTRVITDGVTPSLHIDYKNTTIKQYHKRGERCAPRPPSTTPRLRCHQTADQPARPAAARLLRQPAPARRPNHQPRPHPRRPSLSRLTAPIVTEEGTRIPGLRFGDTRVHTLAAALLVHRSCHGFTNRDLRTLIAPLLGTTAKHITAGKMTYDLRRACAPTDSSNASPTPAATPSPRPGCNTHCCSPRPRPPAPGRTLQVKRPQPPRKTKLHNAARAYQAAIDELTQKRSTRRLTTHDPNHVLDPKLAAGPLKLTNGYHREPIALSQDRRHLCWVDHRRR